MHKNVFILPYSPRALSEWKIVIEALRADDRYHPVCLITRPNLDIDLNKGFGVETVQIEKNARSAADASSATAPGNAIRFKAALKKRIKSLSMVALWDSYKLRQRLRNQLEIASALFERYKPAALLLESDRNLGYVPAFISAARAYDCPVITIPTAHASAGPVIALSRANANQSEHLFRSPNQALIKRWIRRRLPEQVFVSDVHGPVLFYSPAQILALKAMNLLNPNPWIAGGVADRVGILSEEDRQRHIKWGITPEKLQIVGQFSFDSLYQAAQRRDALREELAARYNLAPAHQIIIFTPAILGEHALTDWSTHWRAVHEVIKPLARLQQEVLISLHPKSDPAAYRFLEAEYGVHLLDVPLREVMPAADLFIAAYGSSTVRWSVLLNMPAVAFDFGWFGYDFYDHLEGVVKAYSPEAFAEVVERILNDPAYYAELAEAQRKAAQNLPPFDGQATKRVVAMIAEIH